MSKGKDGAMARGTDGKGGERLPAELSRVNLNAAGIDVGAASHFVAVPEDRWEQPVQEFEAFTTDLYRLDDLACGVPAWRPWSWSPLESIGYRCSECLEERGFQVMLVDPQAHQARARPEDRRGGLPVAAAVAHLRSTLRSLPA